ncbi:MAG TPA: MFS transporter [Actinomycetota bacterium]|nr:MFS transporter [Actinomycetota bacterium]
MSEARPTLRDNLRSMPGSAWILFAGTFVNRLGTFVLPFITLYLTSLHYSAPQAGVAIACYGLGGLTAQAAGGLLADRLGRRNTISTAMLSAAALTVALSRAHSLATIYPLMFALAAMAELHRPAAGALIADLLPSERRVTAFTMYRLAVNLGWACGLALGGLLAEHNFLWLFWGDAATSATFGVIALVALPHGTRTARHEERHLASARSAIVADRGFLLFLAAVLITGAVYSQNVSTLPLKLRVDGYGPSTYGLLQALNGIIIVFAELPVIAWTQRHARMSIVALGDVLIGLAFFSLLFATTLPGFLVMIVVWTVGEMVESPVASAVAADRAPTHARGRYQSAYGSMFGVAWMLGPVLGTSVYAASPTALWIACGVAGVVAANLSLAAGRRPVPSVGPPTSMEVDAPGV